MLVLSFLLLHYLSDFILPSREVRQFFLRRHLFTKISYYMQKQSIMDDKEVMYILRQLGIGAIIGGAFLTALYLGELVAHLCSGM